jgi:lipopolysaccharide/colanic/teichoic acid biosynthesis glycosyltransferase
MRLVALILVPCLLVEPVLASGLTPGLGRFIARPGSPSATESMADDAPLNPPSVFTAQALALRPIAEDPKPEIDDAAARAGGWEPSALDPITRQNILRLREKFEEANELLEAATGWIEEATEGEFDRHVDRSAKVLLDELYMLIESIRATLSLLPADKQSEWIEACKGLAAAVSEMADGLDEKPGSITAGPERSRRAGPAALEHEKWSVTTISRALSRVRSWISSGIGSTIALVLLIASMFFIGLMVSLILWEDPGPASFEDIRVGYQGRPIMLIKLRTWTKEPEESRRRVTRFGRFARPLRLDELPQLWLLVTREMAWFGPRADRSSQISQDYIAKVLDRRPPGVFSRNTVRHIVQEALGLPKQSAETFLLYGVRDIENDGLRERVIVVLMTFCVLITPLLPSPWRKAALHRLAKRLDVTVGTGDHRPIAQDQEQERRAA